MKSVSCLFLVLAMCLSGSLAQDGYETFPSVPGSRYKLNIFTRSWTEAHSLCQSDGGGSHLVIINSHAEASVVRSLFARITDPNLGWLSVGINDIVQEGTWVTVQGGLVTTTGYNVWASGEPNDTGPEDCGVVNRNAEYNDRMCNLPHPFVCEKPVV